MKSIKFLKLLCNICMYPHIDNTTKASQKKVSICIVTNFIYHCSGDTSIYNYMKERRGMKGHYHV